LVLLKRATLRALVARKELGGLFVAACAQVNSREEQEALFRRHLDVNYPDGRRHMRLWTFWNRIEAMLRDRERSCARRGIRFIVPGYRRCLQLAGLEGKSEPPPYEVPRPLVEADPLPDDVAALTAMVKELEKKNRLERAEKARLLVELDLMRDELRDRAFHDADEQTKGIMGTFTGWLKRRRRPLPAPSPERQPEIEVRAGDCLDGGKLRWRSDRFRSRCIAAGRDGPCDSADGAICWVLHDARMLPAEAWWQRSRHLARMWSSDAPDHFQLFGK
jgi:hypothetical protein